MIEVEEQIKKPVLTFDMLQPGRHGGVLAQKAFKGLFGPENYNAFKRAGVRGLSIPEEDKTRVDNETYAKVAYMFGMPEELGEALWKESIDLSDRTFNYAKQRLFPNQDNKSAMITNLAVEERRPSVALERLTKPLEGVGELIGEQYKYDQGRQLALALLCAEIIKSDENGHSRQVLGMINKALETGFFIDRRSGDPKSYPTVYSYHEPFTNRFVGTSDIFPDPQFNQGLWVKALDYAVRTIGVKGNERFSAVNAVYEPRGKDTESTVIKALNRSLKRVDKGGLIETSPFSEDRIGFKIVLMSGDHELRDHITVQLEALFTEMGGERGVKIKEDDRVNEENGRSGRVKFRRRQVLVHDLKKPLEVIVIGLPDHIASEYEVGEFDPELGMHNGQAHELYKLGIVAKVAPYLWPPEIFDLGDRAKKLKRASNEYAGRLGRVDRKYPDPYPEYA